MGEFLGKNTYNLSDEWPDGKKQHSKKLNFVQ